MRGDAENRKALRKAFMRFYKLWPACGDDSYERAFAEWQALAEEDRQAAASQLEAYLAFEAINGRQVKHAASTYLKEKRWSVVPERVASTNGPTIGSTFGRSWMAERFARLAAPCRRLPPLSAFYQRQIAAGLYDGAAVKLERMRKMGWPAVNDMHAQAIREPAKGVRVSRAIAMLGDGFEAVRVDGEIWQVWQAEHDKRGWPWLPDTGRQDWVYFPPLQGGAPSVALEAFFERLERARASEAVA
ncbi:hypothetical protein FJU08_12800 [Martelella alba]|uniref:Uncharacterized protein n=1 Tax=Martelella alba TaxID=2590451 RepID=A0A506U763_9HYPH|nr:hypothetical protein [Martelella alba]TPW29690.1 hypothetical protein FJU08_12800 [Martelella alba]